MSTTALVRRSDLIAIDDDIKRKKIGYIYFVSNAEAEAVKIGFATDVRRRMESLQTGNHIELLSYSGFKSAACVERIIHRALAKYKIKNEWFHHSDEVDELIECFEDRVYSYIGIDDPLMTSKDIDFVIDEWANTFGRGRSAPACGNNVDKCP